MVTEKGLDPAAMVDDASATSCPDPALIIGVGAMIGYDDWRNPPEIPYCPPVKIPPNRPMPFTSSGKAGGVVPIPTFPLSRIKNFGALVLSATVNAVLVPVPTPVIESRAHGVVVPMPTFTALAPVPPKTSVFDAPTTALYPIAVAFVSDPEETFAP